MLVARDDRTGHFRPLEQLAVILRDEIGADFLGDEEPAVVILLRNPDPLHRRVARRDLAAKQADPAGADDGEPERLCLLSHALASAISTTAESASLESGRSTGWLRSADRSAAV